MVKKIRFKKSSGLRHSLPRPGLKKFMFNKNFGQKNWFSFSGLKEKSLRKLGLEKTPPVKLIQCIIVMSFFHFVVF